MNKYKEEDLLIDIAKLIKKYGAETFFSLSQSISSPETTQKLATILSESSKLIRKTQKGAEKHKTNISQSVVISKTLDEIKNTEPELYGVLYPFYEGLIRKDFLPRLSDIREFAIDCGLPAINATSRAKSINPLMISIIGHHNRRLLARIKSVSISRDNNRSLEGWSGIILKNNEGRQE